MVHMRTFLILFGLFPKGFSTFSSIKRGLFNVRMSVTGGKKIRDEKTKKTYIVEQCRRFCAWAGSGWLGPNFYYYNTIVYLNLGK